MPPTVRTCLLALITVLASASLCPAFEPSVEPADPPMEIDFTAPADADEMLTRIISPYYIRQLYGDHEQRDGFFTVRNGIRITRRQIVGDPIRITAVFRARPLPYNDAYHCYIGVVDYRGVETYLLGWKGPNDYMPHHMSTGDRMGRARETFFKTTEKKDYKGNVTVHAVTEPAEALGKWQTLELVWADGKLAGTLNGETLGERELELFDGEGLGLSFLAWDANIDVKSITFESDDPDATIKSRVVPAERFVDPRHEFEPIPTDHEMFTPRKDIFAPCEKPEPLDGPLKAYGLNDKQIIRHVQALADYARRWRHTGDEDCLEMYLRELAMVQALQQPNGDFMTSDWYDSPRIHI